MNIKFVTVNRRHLRRLNAIINDPNVARFLTITPPASLKSTYEYFDLNKKMGNLWWAIILDGETIGGINLMRRAAFARKKMGHVVELGIVIDRAYWNMGIGEKAVRFAIREARRKKFKRLELFVIRENAKAAKLYKRCAFQKEGVMKRYFRIGRRYYDAIMMSKML